jgi:hypothetical protein
MTQPLPQSIPADGSLKVLWVPTIADPAAPQKSELTAPSVVDLSCYLTDTGFQPTTNEETSTDPRLCSRQVYERIGRFTDGLNLTYVYQAQESTAPDNRAFTTLRHRELGYIVTRWGADYELPIEDGDIVDVYPGECGVQQKQPPEANGRLLVTQRIFVRGPVQRDVTVGGS